MITLNGRDISRISQGLGLDPMEMLKVVDFLILAEGIRRPKGLTGVPTLETERGPAFLALRKMKNGQCIFLDNDLCMIHPTRPAVCRSFPFVFRRDSEETYWGLTAQKEICKGLGNGPPVDESQLRALAQNILEDMQVYSEFAREWNRGEVNPTASRLLRAILSDPRFVT